jgi:hypothetical protein
METDNAYVAVVYRRVRNLRKRLAKVNEFEALQNSGSALDVGQIEALQSKSVLEKNAADMEAILESLKEIAAADGNSSASQTLSDKDVMSVASKLGDMNLPDPPKKKNTTMVSTGVSTTSTFSTPSAAPVEGKSAVQTHIRSILRAFHVCSRYTTETGNELPVEVDFFANAALGKSSPIGTNFDINLSNSLRQVGYYLYVSLSSICNYLIT